MTQRPDILIIGGGLIGMLSAWELSRAGQRVCLLERGDTGRESSWAGGGILSPLYPWRYADAVSELATCSQRLYPALLEELQDSSGIDPEWQHSGLLVLDVDDAELANRWAEKFAARLEWLDPAVVSKRFACIPLKPGQSTAWLPEIGQVRNPRLVKALRRSIESAGVTIRSGTEVIDFIVSAGQIRGARTRQGDNIEADRVVVASGAWSGGLLASTGIAPDIEPVRGQMLLYRAEPGVLEEIVLYQSRYLIPRRDGRILVGSTLEHVGFDKAITETAREDLQRAALELLPALANYPIEHHWSGLRPGTPDGIPYICEHPAISGLFLNFGHYRNGVVLAPASARLLADLVTGNTPLIDPSPYRVTA